MEIRLLSDEGVERFPLADLKGLLGRGEGLVWVDIPACDEEAARALLEVFEFHPLAVRDCALPSCVRRATHGERGTALRETVRDRRRARP